MSNRIRNSEPETQPKPKKRSAFGKWMQQVLSGDFLAQENVTKHVPFILYLCGFFLLSIYIGYVFDNTERQKIRTERELEELSAEYKTLKSELESKRQQSSVIKEIQDLGLKEPGKPPVIIEPRSEDNE